MGCGGEILPILAGDHSDSYDHLDGDLGFPLGCFKDACDAKTKVKIGDRIWNLIIT